MRPVAHAPDAHPSRLLQPLPARMECGITNGELLQLAESEFDLFIIADQNLRYQQNLAKRRIAILELSTNDLRRILAAESSIIETIASIKSGDYLQLDIP
jgi:hypothetical protein